MIEAKRIEEEETGVGVGVEGDPGLSKVFGEWQTEEFVPDVVVDVGFFVCWKLVLG